MASGEGHNYKTDVFSLGCVFYSMLTGDSKGLCRISQDCIIPVESKIRSALEDIKLKRGFDAMDLLDKFLKVDPRKRIDLSGNLTKILNTPVFCPALFLQFLHNKNYRDYQCTLQNIYLHDS